MIHHNWRAKDFFLSGQKVVQEVGHKKFKCWLKSEVLAVFLFYQSLKITQNRKNLQDNRLKIILIRFVRVAVAVILPNF